MCVCVCVSHPSIVFSEFLLLELLRWGRVDHVDLQAIHELFKVLDFDGEATQLIDGIGHWRNLIQQMQIINSVASLPFIELVTLLQELEKLT